MQLHSAAVRDFRNIHSADLEFSPQFTCFLGPNGQGKTNTIEALYLVAALRPLRNVTRKALIRAGASEAEIKVRVSHERTGLLHDLGIALRGSARVLTKDEKRCDATQFLGHAVAVAFTPDDLQLAKGGPDARRRFLDRALLNVRPSYLSSALRYQKAVKDRNRLLVEEAADATVDAFDAILAKEGATITCARFDYTSTLTTRVQTRFSEIARPAPALTLTYASSLLGLVSQVEKGAVEDVFRAELARRRDRDRRRKTTSIGPHLDDLVFSLDAQPLRDRASQGQHRALILALKLAQITHLTEQLGEPPVLFLDDMSSELDEERSRQLFEAVRQLRGQVVLTSTDDAKTVLERLGTDVDVGVYQVDEGQFRVKST